MMRRFKIFSLPVMIAVVVGIATLGQVAPLVEDPGCYVYSKSCSC